MKNKFWFCRRCQKRGSVEYGPKDDVFEVVHLIKEDHRRVSPDCPNDVGHVNVVNMEVISEDELAAIMALPVT